MLKRLKGLRSKDKKKYRTVMAKNLARKGKKNAKMSKEQVRSLVSDLKETFTAERSKVLRSKEGYVFLDMSEYAFHWKNRKGGSLKTYEKEFSKQIEKRSAITMVHKTRGKLLGVEKPPELDGEEVLKVAKQLKSGSQIGADKIASLSRGFQTSNGGRIINKN